MRIAIMGMVTGGKSMNSRDVSSAIKRQLCKLAQTHELVILWDDFENANEYCQGRILGFADPYFLWLGYDDHGYYDGYVIDTMSDVYAIEQDSSYIKGQNYLIEQRKEHLPFTVWQKVLTPLAVLQYAKQQHRLVEIQLHNSGLNDAVGYIVKIDEDLVTIARVTTSSPIITDGLAVIVLGDITRVLFDTKNLRDKEMLLDFTSRLATSDEKKAHHEEK